jgi:hypothetical protein
MRSTATGDRVPNDAEWDRPWPLIVTVVEIVLIVAAVVLLVALVYVP